MKKKKERRKRRYKTKRCLSLNNQSMYSLKWNFLCQIRLDWGRIILSFRFLIARMTWTYKAVAFQSENVLQEKKRWGDDLKRSKLLLENKKGRLSFRLQRGMLLAYVCQDQRVTNYRVNDVIRSIEFNQIVTVCIYGEIIAIAATVPFPPPFLDVQLIHEICRCDDLLFLLSVSQQDNH